jgi:hypothetical protein
MRVYINDMVCEVPRHLRAPKKGRYAVQVRLPLDRLSRVVEAYCTPCWEWTP